MCAVNLDRVMGTIEVQCLGI